MRFGAGAHTARVRFGGREQWRHAAAGTDGLACARPARRSRTDDRTRDEPRRAARRRRRQPSGVRARSSWASANRRGDLALGAPPHRGSRSGRARSRSRRTHRLRWSWPRDSPRMPSPVTTMRFSCSRRGRAAKAVSRPGCAWGSSWSSGRRDAWCIDSRSGAIHVARAGRVRALELVVANRGNVTESFARSRAVVFLERGGRRIARLVAEPRELRPFTSRRVPFPLPKRVCHGSGDGAGRARARLRPRDPQDSSCEALTSRPTNIWRSCG